MVKIYRSAVVEATADRAWRLVRDFNGLPQWHPAIAASEIEGVLPADKIGCVRRFTLRSDGGLLREQLLALSDLECTLTYQILSSPMPVANYVARMRVTPVTVGNAAFVEWSAEFDVTSGLAQDIISHIGDNVFVVGFEAMNNILAST